MTKAIKVERRGRKRSPGVLRDKRGKSRGDPHIVHPEAVFVRQRELRQNGVSPDHAMDALAGFTLGILRLRGRDSPKDPGGISEDQFLAGEAWSRIVHRHAAIMGYKLRIHTPSFVMVSRGVAPGFDPDDEEIQRAKTRYRDCYDALAAAARTHGHRVQTVTYAVCVDNLPVEQMTPACYGYLRVGLNALSIIL